MSWDLYLVPTEARAEPSEWLEQHDQAGQNAELARQHAAIVTARRPELELGGPYGDSYQLTLSEDSEMPIDIGLYGNHASITVAYWDLGKRTNELAAIIVDVATALADEAGWILYDPQEDRIIDASELPSLFGSGHAHGVAAVERLSVTAPEPQPKKKRRFGLF